MGEPVQRDSKGRVVRKLGVSKTKGGTGKYSSASDIPDMEYVAPKKAAAMGFKLPDSLPKPKKK